MRQSVDKSWSLVKNCISVMQILFRDMIQYRERVWKLLPMYGVHDKIVKLLQALYSIVSASVRLRVDGGRV